MKFSLYLHDIIIEKLQQLLVDGEACIIEEIGHEKFKYLQAIVTIITKDKYEFLSFDNCFMDFARRVLDNPDYTTEMTY